MEKMPWDKTLQGCLSRGFLHLKKVVISTQALKFLRTIHAEIDRPNCTLCRGLWSSLKPPACTVKMWGQNAGSQGFMRVETLKKTKQASVVSPTAAVIYFHGICRPKFAGT